MARGRGEETHELLHQFSPRFLLSLECMVGGGPHPQFHAKAAPNKYFCLFLRTAVRLIK